MKKLSITFLLVTICIVFTNFKEANTLRLSTKLQVTVLDDIGNIQKNAKVILYAHIKYYDLKKHPAASGKTNEKGQIVFKNLKAIPYFIHAERGNKDNTLGATKVGRLKKGKMNKVNVIISDF